MASAIELPENFIVVVGRLSRLKQVEKIIEAFDNSAIHKLFHLVIVGDGLELCKLQQKALQSSVGYKMQFTGFVDRPVSIMARASLLVFASVKEGFPTVLVEALTAGVPAKIKMYESA